LLNAVSMSQCSQHVSKMPFSAFRIRVEQAQIRDEVFLVVNGQHEIGGRGIGYIGIKRRLLYRPSRRCREQKGCPLLSRTDLLRSDAKVGSE
jgi:hypothetical protein